MSQLRSPFSSIVFGPHLHLHAQISDFDSDGISDEVELRIGTDPEDIDSEGDAIDDLTEVGNLDSPLDTDGDGIIDALENNYLDHDRDSTFDLEPRRCRRPGSGQGCRRPRRRV